MVSLLFPLLVKIHMKTDFSLGSLSPKMTFKIFKKSHNPELQRSTLMGLDEK